MHKQNWDDLRLFLAVARHGRFIAAGRALGIDHTTVARRVTQLEEAVGARLLERSPRGVALTEAGRALVAHSERVEAEIFSANVTLGGTDARISGVVRLATPEAFGTYLAAANAYRLHEKHPDLRLELMPESQQVRLANRDTDVAILLNRPPRGPIVARRLVEYRVGLYASRRYLERHGPINDIDQLSRHPFAWYIEEMIDIPELRFLREVSEEAMPVFRSTSTAAQHEAVANGMGLGLLHAFNAQHDTRLVHILSEKVEIRRAYWLAIHEDLQHVPRIRAVVEFLDDIIAINRDGF